jgi:hypothetical protein
MSPLELVTGTWEWLFVPLALLGIALNGLGWILLGLDLGLRRRAAAAAPIPPPADRPPGT